jgi:GNAT superfamily N-acetyltransferase
VVADTARRSASTDGLQPLRLARDWRQVIDLIEVAFGENLDVEARRALHSMRLPPLLAPFIGLLDSLALPGEGMMPGFVWLERGRVVGTASVRRVHPFKQGWLVSNVAVHPDFQGRGIGRGLLEASMDYAQAYGAKWIILQVRRDNRAARRLYESLGFRQVGEVLRLRKADADWGKVSLPTAGLRPARWSDGSALSRLARELTPHDVLWADIFNRALYKTGMLNRCIARLKGSRRQWWVQDEAAASLRYPRRTTYWAGYGLSAAVGVEVNPRNPWHRLRLLISPRTKDERLASRLIAFGLNQLADAPTLPVEVEYPTSDTTAQSALTESGFEPLYALIHLRLDLEKTI